MSLPVADAALSGPQATAAGASTQTTAGLPALFAALLAAQSKEVTALATTSTTTTGRAADSSTLFPAPATTTKDGKKGAADDGTNNTAAPPADPNAAVANVALFVPPPSVPIAVPPVNVSLAPPALSVKNQEVMDTAPVQAASRELLPQSLCTTPNASVPTLTAQNVAPAVQESVPAVTSQTAITPRAANAVPQTAGFAPPQEVIAAPQAAPPVPDAHSASPDARANSEKARLVNTLQAGDEGTRPAPPLSGGGGLSLPRSGDPVQWDAAPPQLWPGGTSAALPPVQAQTAQAQPVQQVQTAQVTTSAVQVTASAVPPQTLPKTTLQNTPAPANNTGRSQPRQAEARLTKAAAQAAPAFAQTAGVTVEQPIAPRPETADADKKESTGFPDLPAPQAPNLTTQTAHAVKTDVPEPRGTAAAQVADKIVSLPTVPGKAQQVTVNLHPHEWGHVRVEVTQAAANADGTAGALTAKLTAENPEARAALHASTGELRRALEDAGLHLDSVTIADTVQTVSQSAAASADNGAPFRQGESGQNSLYGQPDGAFAGSQNPSHGGGRDSFSQNSGRGPSWTPEPEATHLEPHYIASQNIAAHTGVDVRA